LKRITALVLSAAALVALAAVAQAHHRPGHQGGPQNTLTIDARPNPVVYLRTVGISGRYRAQNDSGQTIQLQKDSWPFEGTWVNAGTTTTNFRGDYSFTDRPPVNTRYRTMRANIFSVPVTVGVRIRVSRRVSDRTPRSGQRVRFRGRACPEHDGARVRIQRFNRRIKRWRTIRRTRLRDLEPSNCSRYRRTFRVFRDGTYRVVVVSPHGDHRNGISRRIRLNAH
jgi:hypothetical protein